MSSKEAKRILALSGGGVRGIIEVAFLEAIDREYKRRFGPDTRLCDVFDLVGGSSTGALIATAIALGHPMDRIRNFYIQRAAKFFSQKRWWRFGRAPIFDCAGLEREIRIDVGSTTLGDPSIQTLLAIVAKRLDTGAPWILNNIPSAPYFETPADNSYIGNRHFELARILRAATSAPTMFSPQHLEIVEGQPLGVFVDGGLTPYNDPSLALLKLARMRAFGLSWPTGPDKLFVLSLGTGRFRSRFAPADLARMGPLRLAFHAVLGAVRDAEMHALTMMEWMAVSDAPSYLNSEVQSLGSETLADEALFRFLRLDIPLESHPHLQKMDDPMVIAPLYDLACQHIDGLDLEKLLY